MEDSHHSPRGMTQPGSQEEKPRNPARRGFLGWSAAAAMLGGLTAGYGTFAAFAGRFLYPAAPPSKGWMFVSELSRIGQGSSILYRAPNGAPISITRQGEGATEADFVALSTVCPHLGCAVHWEAQNNRFFCPCHNGVFDPTGFGTSGPPKGQRLAAYPLKIENGLLFIEVATDVAESRPGHRHERERATARVNGPCADRERA